MEQKSKLSKVNDGIAGVELAAASVVFFAMLVMIIIQVIFRYVLKVPLAWTDEMLRFLFIGASFLGAIVATKQRKHVEVNFISTMITKKCKTEPSRKRALFAVDLIDEVVGFGFSVYIAQMMVAYTVEMKSMNQLSIAMSMPLWWIIAVIALSFVMCAFHFLMSFFLTIQEILADRKGRVTA